MSDVSRIIYRLEELVEKGVLQSYQSDTYTHRTWHVFVNGETITFSTTEIKAFLEGVKIGLGAAREG